MYLKVSTEDKQEKLEDLEMMEFLWKTEVQDETESQGDTESQLDIIWRESQTSHLVVSMLDQSKRSLKQRTKPKENQGIGFESYDEFESYQRWMNQIESIVDKRIESIADKRIDEKLKLIGIKHHHNQEVCCQC